MVRIPSRPPEIALPVASIEAVRRTLAEELGPDEAAVVLRKAGQAAGEALFPLLADASAADPSARADEGIEAHATAFWRRLSELLASRGWGHMAHDAVHPGVGALESSDCAEADATDTSTRPSCHFTTGMLASLLGQTAGDDVGVLEVECRSRGDLRCLFVFGGAAALEAVYEKVAAGETIDAVLQALH